MGLARKGFLAGSVGVFAGAPPLKSGSVMLSRTGTFDTVGAGLQFSLWSRATQSQAPSVTVASGLPPAEARWGICSEMPHLKVIFTAAAGTPALYVTSSLLLNVSLNS